MLMACTAGLLGLITFGACGALADDMPTRKAGLWEVSFRMANMNMPPQTMKFCTDAATDAEQFKSIEHGAQDMCSRKDVQRSGSVVTIDAECKMGDTKMVSHTVMTFLGDSSYRTSIQSHFDPPAAGHGDTSMTQEAKWVGPCPAGMAPGEMIGPNGMKMNMRPTGQ